MATPEDVVVATVAETIQRYLDAHPNAADSVEGITRWWLTRQRYEEAIKIVEQALERLVAEGKVAKTVTAEGTVLYSCAHLRLKHDSLHQK
jgi:hypothetical protein